MQYPCFSSIYDTSISPGAARIFNLPLHLAPFCDLYFLPGAGSISKSVTCVGLMALIEQGDIPGMTSLAELGECTIEFSMADLLLPAGRQIHAGSEAPDPPPRAGLAHPPLLLLPVSAGRTTAEVLVPEVTAIKGYSDHKPFTLGMLASHTSVLICCIPPHNLPLYVLGFYNRTRIHLTGSRPRAERTRTRDSRPGAILQ